MKSILFYTISRAQVQGLLQSAFSVCPWMSWNKNAKCDLTVLVVVLKSDGISVAWDPIACIFFLSVGIFWSEGTLHVVSYSSSDCFQKCENFCLFLPLANPVLAGATLQGVVHSMGCVTRKWSILLLRSGKCFDPLCEVLHLQSKPSECFARCQCGAKEKKHSAVFLSLCWIWTILLLVWLLVSNLGSLKKSVFVGIS